MTGPCPAYNEIPVEELQSAQFVYACVLLRADIMKACIA